MLGLEKAGAGCMWHKLKSPNYSLEKHFHQSPILPIMSVRVGLAPQTSIQDDWTIGVNAQCSLNSPCLDRLL
eukprot:3669614-Amphidinium_carterae.1